MQNKKSSSHVYDYVVVGAGLSGLVIASALSKISDNVLLLEAGENIGGLNFPLSLAHGKTTNGLRLLPESSLSYKAIGFLHQVIGQELQIKVEENAPITFENGGLKPFVGFGENSPTFYDEIAYFLSPKRLSVNPEPFDWSQLLLNSFQGEVIPRSHVTKFIGNGEKIESVIVNGQKTIHGQNFIYCGPIRDLVGLMPDFAIGARIRQKISKAKFWTAVCLDILHHGQISDVMTTHLLDGTTSDDIGPCIGRFYPAFEEANGMKQYSQWVSFIDGEDAEESENIANTLKKMKRQIKRAYPQAFDKIQFERILVAPEIAGDADLKLSADQTLSDCPNVWIGTGTVHQQKNLLGSLLQAEMVCSSLSCHPAGVQHATVEEQDQSSEGLQL